MQEVKLLKKLLPLLGDYSRSILAIITLGILSSLSEGIGLTLLIPFLNSFETQGSQENNSNALIQSLNQLFSSFSFTHRLIYIPLIIWGCILVKNLLYYTNLALLSWLNSRIAHRLRCDVFHQILTVSYSFLDNQESGKILNTLATETWRTNDALGILVKLSISICLTVVYLILLFLISWQLTLVVTIIMALISLLTRWIKHKSNYLSYKAVEANSTLTIRMYEGFTGMKTIRAFAREKYEQKRFEIASGKVRDRFFALDLIGNSLNPLYEIISATVVIGILIVALLYNRTTLPSLLTFLFILYRLQPQIQQIDGSRVTLLTLSSSVENVMNFLAKTDKTYIHSGSIPFTDLKSGITLESVNFRYHSENKLALEDISFHIPQGKITALVGTSGAGKSTLIHLICRFYEITDGKIYVDNHLLQDLDIVSWRNNIAIVNQEIHLFSTTIRENIAYGDLKATETEIVIAAKQAHAHEFICQLPNGYDTPVGDRGVKLSGGQRQRIALARAILRKPEILILDEATNALDSISEQLIQEALQTIKKDRTVIVIAHRLSTVEQADQIIVLDQGKIIEQGNFRQLLQLNGLFSQLYSS